MPLPDERIIPKASLLIARFQNNIVKSNESPLVPISSFGSAGGSKVQPIVSKGLGVHTDLLRKSLGSSSSTGTSSSSGSKSVYSDGISKLNNDNEVEDKSWIKSNTTSTIPTVNHPVIEIVTALPKEEVVEETTAEEGKVEVQERVVTLSELSPIIITEPEGTESPAPEPILSEPLPYSISPSTSTHSLLPSSFDSIDTVESPLSTTSEMSLPAREGLSRPASPAVLDSRRLSVPVLLDDQSPPPTTPPRSDSPPLALEPTLLLEPIVDPLINSSLAPSIITTSGGEENITGPNLNTKIRKSISGPSSIPTASSLAKAKPKISNSTTTSTTSTKKTTTTTTSTPSTRPRSSIASGSPVAKKLRPSNSSSPLISSSSISINQPQSIAMSPSSSKNSNTSSTSSNTSISNNNNNNNNQMINLTSTPPPALISVPSPTRGHVRSAAISPPSRKNIKSTPPTNGTPRSRAAAAAAAALINVTSSSSSSTATNTISPNGSRSGSPGGKKSIPNSPKMGFKSPHSPLSNNTRSLPSSPLMKSSTLHPPPSTSTTTSTTSQTESVKSSSGGKPQRTGVGVLGYSLVSGEQIGSNKKLTTKGEVQQFENESGNEEGEEEEGKWGRESEGEEEKEQEKLK